MAERADADPPVEVAGALTGIAKYGRSIDAQVEAGTPVADILGVIIGPEYAMNMAAVRHLRNEYDESLPADTQAEIQAVGELLESVAVVRQSSRTLALQQDFGTLSRQLIYTGLVALLVSVPMTLVYRTGSVGPFVPPEER